ncbi:MAG: Unknown protein [uncultured Sulfurovum sp.]|uniref:Uncharacterized protein n=1 Tax=uncultured Sulfurovum sp. TaxID=269237 RepID=A0A6S6U8E0_9BACT|nr:MAG: Unknown protein [uncultured Sulfurovum sp.]
MKYSQKKATPKKRQLPSKTNYPITKINSSHPSDVHQEHQNELVPNKPPKYVVPTS